MCVRYKWEGTYIHLWLIHVDVWHKSNQYYRAIIPQLNIYIYIYIYIYFFFNLKTKRPFYSPTESLNG